MHSTTLVRQENGKKAKNIEISVDACAELGGQVYSTISALRNVYRLSTNRKVTYVDTYQGMREKSDATTPETLFAFGEPYSDYGKFLYQNQDWHRISETNECRQFIDTLGHAILPSQTAPIFTAVDAMTAAIRKEVFHKLQRRGETRLGDKTILSPDDVDLVVHSYKTRYTGSDKQEIPEPYVREAIDKLMPKWTKIVAANPVLAQAKTSNRTKAMLVSLIKETQDCKAISAALLYQANPEAAERMGKIPDVVKRSKALPSLPQLRDSAHQFGTLTFPHDPAVWQQPEVQQALRYTSLWPWTRKPYMKPEAHSLLRDAHKNTADRAAISYFMNDLSKREDAADTLYILVTHDGPLISDFIKFITGVERRDSTIKVSRLKNVPKERVTTFKPVPEEEYASRKLEPVAHETMPFSAIVTGNEFINFVERQQERVQKKVPMTHELQQAMDTLTQQLDLLKTTVKRDKQKFGLTKGGTFADRVRANTTAGTGQQSIVER